VLAVWYGRILKQSGNQRVSVPAIICSGHPSHGPRYHAPAQLLKPGARPARCVMAGALFNTANVYIHYRRRRIDVGPGAGGLMHHRREMSP